MTKAIIIKLITMYSLAYNIDPKIALSVVEIESGYNQNAIGVTKDIGLFQLNPNSFPEYTQNELLSPELNIKLGVKYLAKMKKECKYKEDNLWLICWNIGKNYKKPINHPRLFPYIKKINIVMGRNL
jgi:soluble lytic murein transglycosylase-like protein